jgi:hypothetical protein
MAAICVGEVGREGRLLFGEEQAALAAGGELE